MCVCLCVSRLAGPKKKCVRWITYRVKKTPLVTWRPTYRTSRLVTNWHWTSRQRISINDWVHTSLFHWNLGCKTNGQNMAIFNISYQTETCMFMLGIWLIQAAPYNLFYILGRKTADQYLLTNVVSSPNRHMLPFGQKTANSEVWGNSIYGSTLSLAIFDIQGVYCMEPLKGHALSIYLWMSSKHSRKTFKRLKSLLRGGFSSFILQVCSI